MKTAVKTRKKNAKAVRWILIILGIFLCAGCYLPRENLLLDGFALNGFALAKPLVIYNRTNIFDYLDGEAEVYLPLGFRRLYSQTYRNTGTDVLMIADIYDMGAPDGARAVFSQYTQKNGSEVQALGEKAWTDTYIVLFRKGNYFCRVWPDPYQESDVKPGLTDMVELSREIDKAF